MTHAMHATERERERETSELQNGRAGMGAAISGDGRD